MRLPEAKIKEAIVHPEKLVRQEALLYFTDCYSRDSEVMPLAIKAVETYGRSNAYLHLHAPGSIGADPRPRSSGPSAIRN